MKIGKLGMGLIGLALVAMTGCQSAAKPQEDSWSTLEAKEMCIRDRNRAGAIVIVMS